MTFDTSQYFYHFIQFSPFANKKERRMLANDIYACLTKARKALSKYRSRDAALWRKALGAILFSTGGNGGKFAPQSGALVDMPFYGLETEVTSEILAFVEKTGLSYKDDESFTEERALIEECRGLSASVFAEYWDGFRSYIESCYAKHELDAAFYHDMLAKTICAKEGALTGARLEATTNIRDLFIEKWEALVERKIRLAKKAYIMDQAAPFSRQLRQKVADFRQALSIFGVSSEDTRKIYNASRSKPAHSRAAVLEKAEAFYKNDAALQHLARQLGRQRRERTDKKKCPPVQRRVGIAYSGMTTGGSLSAMPGGEAALMADEDCSLLFFIRFAEKQLLNYEQKPVYATVYPGRDDARREGPFILCVDTSGSMQGEPEIVAKSLCFALLKLSLNDKRKCCLISFAIDTMELELTDLANNFDALCAFLSESFRGGTDITAAFHRALDLLETEVYQDADVLVISDFIMPRLSAQTLERIRQRKECGAEFVSILVGQSRAANPALTGIFDRQLSYGASGIC